MLFHASGEPDEFKVENQTSEVNESSESILMKQSDQTMIGNFKWGQLKRMRGFGGFNMNDYLNTLAPEDRLKF